MAGHSQFKNIMFRKGAQDKKRARLFARLGREIQVAARSGGDPVHNPGLRSAIENARAENMPRDNIQRAIKKGSGQAGEAAQYHAVTYEGYASGGVAVIVECLTDNKNRSAAQVRSCFSKHGGALSEKGTVLYQFQRRGEITFGDQHEDNADKLFELAIESGAENLEWNSMENNVTFTTKPDDIHTVATFLESHMPRPLKSGLAWHQASDIPVSGEVGQSVVRLLSALEELDDVQEVFSNIEISSEDLMAMTEVQ